MIKRICLRFHMSKIFDNCWANRIIDVIKNYGELCCVVAGTMGRIAMMDNNVGNINILKERFVDWINKENFDLVISATHTTSVNRMLADIWHLSKKIKYPIIGIETNTHTVAYINEEIEDIAKKIANDLKFKLMKGIDFGNNYWIDGNREYRKVLATEIGDWLLINGIIVGKVKSNDVIIVCENNNIIDIKGVEIKKHGIEKIGKIDLKNAKIDSISLLRDESNKRTYIPMVKKEKIAYIEHAGYNIFKFIEEGICCAVTIGDDTTAIVGDILERFDIPIIGIIDGDKDGLIKGEKLHPNSIILKVKSDDEFGRRIYEEIFNKRNIIDGNFNWIKERIYELLS
ncbi:MAG: DUF2117 domain-containing protein [Candidatus Methanomethylicia archaeon]|nr:DUF2117 domain-containing protein [Candidatus Methanomethylicia archaeon]